MMDILDNSAVESNRLVRRIGKAIVSAGHTPNRLDSVYVLEPVHELPDDIVQTRTEATALSVRRKEG